MKSDPAPAPYYSSSAYTTAPPPSTAPVNQQYRSHETPGFRPSPYFNPAPTPTAAAKEEPQYARFDAKPQNEDSLPAMPSWNDAKDVHVQEVSPEKPNDMEMDRLDRNGSVAGTSLAGTTAVAGPGGPRRSPGPGRSPMRTGTQDSYGFPQGYQNDSFVSGAPQRTPPMQGRPYGQNNGYDGPQTQDTYDISPVEQSVSPVYGGGAGYAQNGYEQQNQQQYDRRSPAPSYGQQQQQQQQYRRPSPAQTPPNAYGYPAPQQPAPMYQQNNYSGPQRSVTPAAYPGQQTYEASETSSYPGQKSYQAFTPGQLQGQQSSGVMRRPVEGSWKEV